MKFLLLPPTSIHAFTRQAGCRRVWNGPVRGCYRRLECEAGRGHGYGQHGHGNGQQARWMSSSYEAYAESLARRKNRNTTHLTPTPLTRSAKRVGVADDTNQSQSQSQTEQTRRPLSFPALGLDLPFVRALQKAFPDVKSPTGIQEQLIPEILSGKDVLLRDATGSGKTFGMVVALLNKPRMIIHEEDGGKRRVATTLFVVPHRDLALQIYHWIDLLTSAMSPAPALASIAQVLVRGADRPVEDAVKKLRETPPHILICTPQALMEVFKKDREALGLETLSAVVVDEVDYLVETVARKEEGKAFRKAFEKAVRKVERHPGPTREILDVIYKGRKELARKVFEEDEEGEYESVKEWRSEKEAEAGYPQLVLSSATMRVHLKDYLFGESGWLNVDNLSKIMGDTSSAENRNGWKRDRRILHSVLIASSTEIRNISGAVDAPGAPIPAPAEASETEEVMEDGEADGNVYWNEKYGQTPSPFDASALETIAASFALDVPSHALLVIPSSAPVQRAVYELREMGVNAEMLDVESSKRGGGYLLGGGAVMSANPRLLVATLASTRGIDLPGLTHVFVLGVAEGPRVNGRSVDAYVHIAGRVGRFGRWGRVVSVVSSAEEGARVARILTTIGEQPVRFEQFD